MVTDVAINSWINQDGCVWDKLGMRLKSSSLALLRI